MKTREPLFVALTVVAFELGACSQARLKPKVDLQSQLVSSSTTIMVTIEGTRWDFPVEDADLLQSPTWKGPETAAPPPLSMTGAIAVASREVPRYVADASQWSVSEVELHSLGKERLWFYVVGYRHTGELKGDSLPIPVLMSGRAISGSRGDQR